MAPPFDITQPDDRPETRVRIAGLNIDLVDLGSGQPILYLHGLDGIFPDHPFLLGLSQKARVIAPWHPGFGHSEGPDAFQTIHDLANFYAHFLREQDLKDVTVIGAGFGGWIALELAATGCERIGTLALIGSVGMKFRDRETREIADIYGTPFAQFEALEYADPDNKLNKYTEMSDWQMWALARSREAVARYGWKPYMHDPALRHWAGLIDVPTLVVWGAEDGVTPPDYGRQMAGAIPGAVFETVTKAGHHPWHEQPEDTLRLLREFLETSAAARHEAA
ncbi:alpha/beta hydrolase [Mameliella alba]|nr:alpha/beta hydrolase [Antarctobacter heliothermus]MBY6144428.1 alpha/beta hydrolase [Mameliella alba]MCA0954477.1 alpha/beta hydrolase [Mameliella alba]